MTKKALLIIDVQNGMFQEGNAVFNGDRLLKKVNDLLKEARLNKTNGFGSWGENIK